MVFEWGLYGTTLGILGLNCIVLVSRSALNLVITGRRDSNLTCPSTYKSVLVRSVTFHVRLCFATQDL